VLGDRRAQELVDAIDYDFTRFRGMSLSGSVFRSSIFDGWTARFLREDPAGTVVELGTGLNTRFDRLDNGIQAANTILARATRPALTSGSEATPAPTGVFAQARRPDDALGAWVGNNLVWWGEVIPAGWPWSIRIRGSAESPPCPGVGRTNLRSGHRDCTHGAAECDFVALTAE
jgi:hypothetical protein